MRRVLVASAVCVVACAGTASSARADEEPEGPVHYADQRVRQVPQPDASLGYHQPVLYPTLAWTLLQFVPSPEVAFGKAGHDTGPAFGLRWEVTPLLWSFGVHPSQSRWRSLVVDPIARHSGSLELTGGLDYIGGHVDRTFTRATLRVHLPLAHRGEYLATSLGTTAYDFDGLRVGYEAGLYTLGGMVGAQMTLAPTHAPIAALTTLRLRFF